jgi:peptidoglycan-N-acetylglucosamine deacetylase
LYKFWINLTVKIISFAIGSCTLPVLVCGYAQAPVEIALSFDDFPMGTTFLYSKKERVRVYADKLTQLGIQAVFFCIGEQMNTPEGQACLDLLPPSQLIANHSYAHRHLSSLEIDEFRKDLTMTAEIMQERANYRYWFRFPYLDYGDRSQLGGDDRKRTAAFLTLREAKYQHGYVTIHTLDWYLNAYLKQTLKEGQKIHLNRLRAAYLALLEEWMNDYHTCWSRILKRPFVHVLLLHQNDLNALFLNDIVAMIQNKNWVIVSPDKAFCTPIPYLANFANTRIGLFRTQGLLTKEHVNDTLAAYRVFSENDPPYSSISSTASSK